MRERVVVFLRRVHLATACGMFGTEAFRGVDERGLPLDNPVLENGRDDENVLTDPVPFGTDGRGSVVLRSTPGPA